ncbi:hypothetical protein [Rothia kristinae]|uniref:hypothetical protein n=1 Tax=Rothia kristinae TaxID=37923 RepID=UPI0022E060AE|nr:hypothetical protein [Rothia kristinae]
MSENEAVEKAQKLRRWSVILGVIALVLCLTGAVLLGIGRHAGDTATAPSATTETPATSAGTDAEAGGQLLQHPRGGHTPVSSAVPGAEPRARAL